jgi:hypothetical protein
MASEGSVMEERAGDWDFGLPVLRPEELGDDYVIRSDAEADLEERA